MAGEELVEGVLAGDVDRQPAAPPAGPAPHLAEAGDGSGKRDHDCRVEAADVDAELEGVGRDHGAQLAGGEPPLDVAALVGRVAGPVGRDPGRELAGAEFVERGLGHPADELDGLAGPDEADRADAVGDQPREELGALGEGRPPQAEGLVCERGVPDGDPPAAGRGAVAVDQGDLVEAGQPLGEVEGVGDGRRGEQEAGLGPVGGGDPPQAADHVGDVGAEDPPVDVGLVDRDDRQVGEEGLPGRVAGEDPEVEHVGVGEDDVGLPADLGPRLGRRVAVVDRRADPPSHPEGVDRAGLVLGEGLRRIEVEGPGLGVMGEGLEHREVKAEGLAGGRAGRDDHRAGCRRRRGRRPGASRGRRSRPAGGLRGRRGGDRRGGRRGWPAGRGRRPCGRPDRRRESRPRLLGGRVRGCREAWSGHPLA